MSFIFPDTEDSILLHHICSHQQNNPCYDQPDINQPRCHHSFVFNEYLPNTPASPHRKPPVIVSAVPLTISFRSSLSESCSLDTLLPKLSLPILIFNHHLMISSFVSRIPFFPRRPTFLNVASTPLVTIPSPP